MVNRERKSGKMQTISAAYDEFYDNDREMTLHERIDLLAQHIRKISAMKMQIGRLVSQLSFEDKKIPAPLRLPLVDEVCVTPIEATNLNGITVSAIDGGLITRSLVGLDLFFLRSVAVSLTFSSHGIYRVSYFPSKYPSLEFYHLKNTSKQMEAETIAGLYRTIHEISTAAKLIKSSRKHIDFLLMDGGFPDQYLSLSKPYTRLHYALKKVLIDLITRAQDKGIYVAWIVKDSRATLFNEFLTQIIPYVIKKVPALYKLDYRTLLKSNRDMDLFFYILSVGSRSFTLRKKELELTLEDEDTDASLMNQTSNDFLTSTDEKQFLTNVLSHDDDDRTYLAGDLYSFYLKVVPYDVPLRIEFVDTNPNSDRQDVITTANKISAVVLPLSQFNHQYGVPSPIIEADARCKIKREEIDGIISYLQKYTQAPEVWIKRREKSPWNW